MSQVSQKSSLLLSPVSFSQVQMDIYFKAVKPALKTPYSLGHRIAEIKNGEYPKSKVCLIDLYILL